MRTSARSNKGIGLIEILMTMFVLAVGVVGVAGLNSVIGRQSVENKARAEAQAIAQSRIERIRNYTNDVTTQAGFDSWYTAVTNGNSATVNGINAVFTRTETIVDSGENKNVQVNVHWTNLNGDIQTVALNTTVSYISPRTIGDSGNGAASGSVNAPTGSAELGNGTVPTGATLEPSNDDGTTLFEDGDDLKLVDCTDPTQNTTTSCSNVVLTLANACINDPCTAFAKIQGTVYVNTAAGSGQFLQPSEMFLVASDAAFCARYYISGGVVNKVTASTTLNDIPLTSTGSDYRSFAYRCYVGGGWHGNIGFVFNGSGNNPSKGMRGCTGDPVTTDSAKTPRVAIRRAYRGLLYKFGPDGPSGPHVQINGEDRLYSHGIIDGAQLSGHDFVLAKIDEVNTECTTIAMVGAGSSSGNLFAGQPRDFFCLNNGYLDEFDTAKFGYDTECPYDPTNPPSSKYQIEGMVSFAAADNTTNLALANGIIVKTSDGTTCENPSDAAAPLSWNHNGTHYQASYSCSVYDWGTQAAPIGWSGDIQLTYDTASVQCTPNTISYSAVQGDDSTGNDFTGCSTGAAAVWSGTVSQLGGG
jgi:Tfp pilus assembly protein PilV